jgi:hypothetical protein
MPLNAWRFWVRVTILRRCRKADSLSLRERVRVGAGRGQAVRLPHLSPLPKGGKYILARQRNTLTQA